MRMKKRGEKQEEGERGRRKRKRFLMTLERIRRETGLNAQVKQLYIYFLKTYFQVVIYFFYLVFECYLFFKNYNLPEHYQLSIITNNLEWRMMSISVLVIVMVTHHRHVNVVSG